MSDEVEPPMPTAGSLLGITVCIPSVRGETIRAAIESIRRQSWADWELLVVMQGDSRELKKCVASASREDPRIRGMWIPQRGVSRARNAGIGNARCGTIAFIDDDCEAEPNWLARVHEAFSADPSVGVVAGVLEAPVWTGRRPSTCPAVAQRDTVFRPTADERTLPLGTGFASANVAFRHWVWDRVAPFDENLGAGETFGGGEDLDMLMRLVDARIPIRFTSSAVVRHTYGTRHGVRPVFRMSVGYATGQGAVAAKLTLRGDDGESWRAAMREQCVTTPLRSLRLHRVVRSLPRLAAFERSYRRCLRHFTVDTSGLLRRRQA